MAAEIAASAPDSWAEVVVSVKATVLTYDFRVVVRLADGRPGAMDVPPGLAGEFSRLREDSYQPGRGTWLSATVAVRADGSTRADFNLDDDPEWFPPLAPGAFSRELEVFPRDDEHVPAWLAEQVRLGREMDEQWEAEVAGNAGAAPQ